MIATDAAAATPAGLDTLDWELKYLLPPSAAPSALSWLQAVCIPDRRHPRNIVMSVYYDTPGLQALNEKINSDYQKSKVRVRWYADPAGRTTPLVHAEAKHRFGGRREKLRVQLPDAANELSRLPLGDGRWRELLEPLREHGVVLPAGLMPMFAVQYQRHRFTEPRRGVRVSLDAHIRVSAVNYAMFTHAPVDELDTAVLEVKATVIDEEGPLARVGRLGCRKASFSKYAACYQLITRARF
jgi:hypothetical protein